MRLPKWTAASLVLALACGVASAQDKEEKQEDRQADRGSRRRGMMRRDDSAPKVGTAAPAIKLKSLDGKDEFELAGFKGKKPVVLFFGSYT
jgi:hypothetical protein